MFTGIEEANGDSVIDVKLDAALVTVRLAVPCTVPDWAVTVNTPTATPVPRPELLIVAKVGSEVLQVTELVMSLVLLSVNVPVAVNCCVPPAAIDMAAGVTRSDESDGAEKVAEPPDCPLLPQPTQKVREHMISTSDAVFTGFSN